MTLRRFLRCDGAIGKIFLLISNPVASELMLPTVRTRRRVRPIMSKSATGIDIMPKSREFDVLSTGELKKSELKAQQLKCWMHYK
ncbi:MULTISPECIES: hypothetical protein [unclassified Microcoleus]|uniref:hypothetical protein n=1 Tax=unclassified Microcoleus TaxID=2642155 RepID=UPI002FD34DEE